MNSHDGKAWSVGAVAIEEAVACFKFFLGFQRLGATAGDGLGWCG